MSVLKLLTAPFVLIRELHRMVLVHLPGDLGIRLRYLAYRKKFKSCGENVYVDTGVEFRGMEHISIGSNVHIDKNCILYAGTETVGHNKRVQNPLFSGTPGEIVIGDHTHIVQQCIVMGFGGVEIGPHCTLSAATKIYSQSNLPYNPADRSQIVSIMPYEQAHFIIGPVVLEENVWVGLNCVLMPGTAIAENSFVVSNSLVKNSFESNSYIQGQPAKRVRDRFGE